MDENQLFMFAAEIMAGAGKTPPAKRQHLLRVRSRRPSVPGMAGARCRNLCCGNGWSMIWEKAHAGAPSARAS